eukprot:7403084-Pyramimonas_sp.AAC.1
MLWTFGVSSASGFARVATSTWRPLRTSGKSDITTCDSNVGARSCRALRLHALPVRVEEGPPP